MEREKEISEKSLSENAQFMDVDTILARWLKLQKLIKEEITINEISIYMFISFLSYITSVYYNNKSYILFLY